MGYMSYLFSRLCCKSQKLIDSSCLSVVRALKYVHHRAGSTAGYMHSQSHPATSTLCFLVGSGGTGTVVAVAL